MITIGQRSLSLSNFHVTTPPTIKPISPTNPTTGEASSLDLSAIATGAVSTRYPIHAPKKSKQYPYDNMTKKWLWFMCI